MEITVLTLPHLQIFQDKQKNLIFKNVSQFNKNHSVGQIEKFVGSLSYLFFFFQLLPQGMVQRYSFKFKVSRWVEDEDGQMMPGNYSLLLLGQERWGSYCERKLRSWGSCIPATPSPSGKAIEAGRTSCSPLVIGAHAIFSGVCHSVKRLCVAEVLHPLIPSFKDLLSKVLVISNEEN